MQFLRRNWVGLMFCALGLMMVIAHPFVWSQNRAYHSSQPCPPKVSTSDCRTTQNAEVLGIEPHSRTRSQKISFLIGAAFDAISRSVAFEPAGV